MALTRTQLMDLTREYADAVGSDRWSDTTVRYALTRVHQREWGTILGACPSYRTATRSVTTDANGCVAIADLSTTGDTAELLNRVLYVSDGSDQLWQVADLMEIPLGATTSSWPSGLRRVYRSGSLLQLLPVEASAARVVVVNHVPQRVDQLTADSVNVEFPEGHELLLAWGAAALLLVKGGAESDAAMELRSLADQERQDLLADVARTFGQPTVLGGWDSVADYGG